MKTGEDIIGVIDRYCMGVLEYPQGYACDPRALEAVLMILESLREFTMNDDQWELEPPKSYPEYLKKCGYGNAMFTTRGYPERLSLTDKDLDIFRDLSKFWKEYLGGKRAV